MGLLVALAYPDRVARARAGDYLLANGEAAALPADDDLRGCELLAVAECDAGGDGPSRIWSAAPVSVQQASPQPFDANELPRV